MSLRPWLRTAHPAAWVMLALICAVVEVVVIRGSMRYYLSWASLVEGVDGAWTILVVVVAGASAALTAYARPHHLVVDGFPDTGLRTRAAPALVTASIAALVHVLAMAVMLVWGLGQDLPGAPGLVPVLPVLVGLYASAFAGAALSRWGMVSPAVAMAAVVAVITVAQAVTGPALFDFGGVSLVLIGLAPDPVVAVWRSGWMLALAVALALVTMVPGRWRRSRAAWASTLVAVVLAGGLLVSGRPHFVERPVHWVCDDASPRVCVAQEYATLLPAHSEAIGDIAPVAHRVGLPIPPEGYRQSFGGRPRPGTFNVHRHVDLEQLTFDFVQFGIPCSPDWDAADLDQAYVVADWIRDGIGLEEPPGAPRTHPSLDQARTALESLRCDAS